MFVLAVRFSDVASLNGQDWRIWKDSESRNRDQGDDYEGRFDDTIRTVEINEEVTK